MLYLIKSGNYLKIGYARNLEKRLKAYYTHNPDIEVISVRDGNVDAEKNLHEKCKKYNYRNEWFFDCKEVREIFSGGNIKDNTTIVELKAKIYQLLDENSDLRTEIKNLKELVENRTDAILELKDIYWKIQESTNNKCDNIDSLIIEYNKLLKVRKQIEECNYRINLLVEENEALHHNLDRILSNKP